MVIQAQRFALDTQPPSALVVDLAGQPIPSDQFVRLQPAAGGFDLVAQLTTTLELFFQSAPRPPHGSRPLLSQFGFDGQERVFGTAPGHVEKAISAVRPLARREIVVPAQ
jgi:hypothetical protein